MSAYATAALQLHLPELNIKSFFRFNLWLIGVIFKW